MSTGNRRDLVKALAGLAPIGALAAVNAVPAQAQQGSSGALDEQKAQAIIAAVKPAVVLLEVEREDGMSWGSAFLVGSDGLLVTNRHVVKDAQKVNCLYRNKTKIVARVLKTDPQYDVAIVKVELPQPAATVTLGDSDAVAEGVLVAATGYAAPRTLVWLGMAVDSSTSRGAVNGQRFGGDVNTFYGDRVIQIDTPISPGSSGGPVTRLDTGEVIGIVVGGSGNMTFAVPINQAKVLIAGAGLQVKPRPLAAGSKELDLETGDLRVLNTVSVSKELPKLFAFPFEFQRNFRFNKEAVDDWRDATGHFPPDVTPLVLEGDDLYFGATDGKLRQWKLENMYEPPTVLLDAGRDSIFLYPPIVTKDVVVAAAGTLDLSQRQEERVTAGSVFRSLFLFGAGATETKTITRIEGQGTLVGLNRHNGNIDWTLETGWVGTPSLYDGKVFYGGMGERGSVDAVQGKQLWKVEKRKGPQADWFHIGYAGSLGVLGIAVPVEAKMSKERLSMLGDGKARLEKYNPADGKLVWKTEFGDVKDRTRTIGTAMFVDEAKGIVYVLAGQVVAALQAGDGKLLWSYDHAKALQEASKGKDAKVKGKQVPDIVFSPQMAIQEGTIYIGSEDKKLYAFNGQDGTLLWTYNTRGPVGHPFYHEGQVLVGSSDGYIHAVDAKSGSLNWRVQTRGAVTSQPLVRQGMVFAATDDGEIQTVRVPLV